MTPTPEQIRAWAENPITKEFFRAAREVRDAAQNRHLENIKAHDAYIIKEEVAYIGGQLAAFDAIFQGVDDFITAAKQAAEEARDGD